MKNIDKVITENVNNYVRQEIKEHYRQKLERCITESEDVIKRFNKIDTNGHKPIMVEHITIDRIVKKHGKEGFIIISASRDDVDPETNDINNRRLLSDIQRSGYSYLPTYGGYQEEGSDEASYEPSYIIFNNQSSMNWAADDVEKLFGLGKEWCAKYNQTCFLGKMPDEPAKYYDRNGNVTTVDETDTVFKNDPSKPAFTTFHNAEQDKKFGIGRRWTHDLKFPEPEEEMHEYVNPIPCTLVERMMRKNEIMIY